jgi:predicted DNA-binding transcriptional regulator YafY
MNEQLIRVLQILLMLPRHPKSLTTNEILEKLNYQGIYVNIRAIQRDMNTLEEVFPNRIDRRRD